MSPATASGAGRRSHRDLRAAPGSGPESLNQEIPPGRSRPNRTNLEGTRAHAEASFPLRSGAWSGQSNTDVIPSASFPEGRCRCNVQPSSSSWIRRLTLSRPASAGGKSARTASGSTPTCSSRSGVPRPERPRASAGAARSGSSASSTPWPTARSSGSGAVSPSGSAAGSAASGRSSAGARLGLIRQLPAAPPLAGSVEAAGPPEPRLDREVVDRGRPTPGTRSLHRPAPRPGSGPTISTSGHRRSRRARPARRTAVQAVSSPVTGRSTRFIDTWATPSDSSTKPSARTPGSPPSTSRTLPGDRTGHEHVVGVEPAVDRDERRSGARPRSRPVRGCGRAGPRSGARVDERLAAQLGERAAAAGRRRRRGTPGRRAPPRATPRRRAPRRPRRSWSSSSATNGTTSSTPNRGCTPSWSVRSSRSARPPAASARAAASASACTGSGEREHGAVVVDVVVHGRGATRRTRAARRVEHVDVATFRDVRDALEHEPKSCACARRAANDAS